MTLRKHVSLILTAALAATMLLTTVSASQASACGSYGEFMTDEARVRRTVTWANATQTAKDRKTGAAVIRRIKSITTNIPNKSGLQSAVVTMFVGWNYSSFTEIVTVVKIKNRWTVANRVKLNRRVKTTVSAL